MIFVGTDNSSSMADTAPPSLPLWRNTWLISSPRANRQPWNPANKPQVPTRG